MHLEEKYIQLTRQRFAAHAKERTIPQPTPGVRHKPRRGFYLELEKGGTQHKPHPARTPHGKSPVPP